MESNKVQSIMITFVYLVIGVAFFYFYGFKITGRSIEIHPQKLTFINLFMSAIVLIVFGLLIIHSKRRIYRRK